MEPFLVAEMIMTWLALPQLHVHAIVLALQSAVRAQPPLATILILSGQEGSIQYTQRKSVTMLERRCNFKVRRAR